MASPLELDGGASPAQAVGLNILFKGVTYSVPSNRTKGESVRLLTDVSGWFKPYEMTALMGPSGSGKTTLLDILAGRKNTGEMDGSILFGSAKPSSAFLRRYTGYVEQADSLIGSLTVRDMLMYTAELKRPVEEPQASKAEAVTQMINRLGLTSCADVLIGDPMTKGISGGQAKRTNIGIALISGSARVVFLDEPTSGLDSFSANEVVEQIRALSRSGVTVVATIHSPSAIAFAMFDRVLMLVRGGTAYFGPNTGDAALVFARQHWPGARDYHVECSASEFLVDVVTQADRDGKAQALVDTYALSDLRKENDATLQQLLEAAAAAAPPVAKKAGVFHHGSKSPSTLDLVADVETGGSNPDKSALQPVAAVDKQLDSQESRLHADLATRNATSTPWWWQLLVLLKFRTRVNYHNPAWVAPRLADKFLFAFVILTLYLMDGDDFSQINLVNLGASLFMWTTLPAFGAVAYVPSIVLERRLFERERADGLYHVATYITFKMVEELLLACFASIAFALFVWFGVQYQGSFLLFWLTYFFTLANGIALGYLIAAISPNMDVANASLPAIVTLHLFMAGQLAVLDRIPGYWRWFSEINFMRWSWSALMLNQFGDEDPDFTGGQTVLNYYGMAGGNKWAHMAYLLAFFAFFCSMAYLGLAYIRHSRR